MTDNPSEPSDNGCYQTLAVVKKSLSDQHFLLNAWLHGRPASTQRCYRRDAEAFLAEIGKPLNQVDLTDVQRWASSLTGAPRSIARHVAAIRSMLGYAMKVGYLAEDPAKHLRTLKPAGGAPRILTEADVQRMIGAERDERARIALRLLYATGIRNSELCALCFRNVTVRKKAIEVAVLGKGSKLRTLEIPAPVWREIEALTSPAKPDDPLIPGRDGGPIGTRALHRLVRRAAKRIGLTDVSPHWLRHAHASHALDRGAPIHLVQTNLGHASLATTTGYVHAKAGDSSSSYLPL